MRIKPFALSPMDCPLNLARMSHELSWRDHEDGRATGADTRGRTEGRPYYSRSLRSAQSRKRVPSFVVVLSDS